MALTSLAYSAAPQLPGVSAALQPSIDQHEIAGAVTMVVTKDRVLHLEADGLADLATQRPMATDTIFAIFSMTKPITATAILMLQDEGKLALSDPVAKYLPAFAGLKTPSGQPANLTLKQLLTHTSGLGEASAKALVDARALADLIPLYLSTPMQFEPGSKWKYCQSGLNTAARIVEIVSGKSFPDFLEARLFKPLGMTDTFHYVPEAKVARVATAYARNKETGALEVVPVSPAAHDRPPYGNMGLYSTAHDYARFCQMLMSGGIIDGHRYLSPAAITLLTTVQTGDLPTGFFQPDHAANYGWGIGTCILRAPHEGVAEMLSAGTYGHGGAWGTQAWIDPVRGVAYVLMVQRSNFANSDASEPRRAFQSAAAKALPR
jgi:CubicO group peptidase (beta-lactamase class C family)